MIGTQLRASDIQLDPEKMKLVTDPQRVLAHVVALRVEEEKPAEAVAAEAAAPAEPEVIKKGKKEAEEGEEVEESSGSREGKEEVAHGKVGQALACPLFAGKMRTVPSWRKVASGFAEDERNRWRGCA